MRVTDLIFLLILIGAGCTDDPIFPEECGSIGAEYCWQHLGIDDWVGSVEVTPRGLFAGTQQNGLLLYSGEMEWEGRGLSHESIDALMYHPASNLLFAGLCGLGEHSDVGVFVSGPEGSSWQPSHGGFDRLSACSFAASGDTLFWGGVIPNILRSTNHGRDWQLLFGSTDAFGNGLNDVLVSERTPGAIYTVGESASFRAYFYRSFDMGATWDPFLLPAHADDAAFDVAEDHSNSARLWVATANGLQRSDDYGSNWHMAVPLFSRALVLEPDRYLLFGGKIVIGEHGETESLLLLESTDGGDTWVEVPTPEEIPPATVVKRERVGRYFVGTERGLWLLEIHPD